LSSLLDGNFYTPNGSSFIAVSFTGNPATFKLVIGCKADN